MRIAAASVLLFAPTCVPAAVPSLEFLHPAGGRSGTTFNLTAGGKFTWPVEAWADTESIRLHAQTNQGVFKVEIDANATPGPHLIRLFNAEGASEPRVMVVGLQPELLEQEPNDATTSAQPIPPLPILINGRLDKSGDTDTFAIHLEKGKWLVGAVDAYSLSSPVDAVLQLFDSAGVPLAFAHDSRNLDPLLSFQVPQTGTYFIQMAGFVYPPQADVRFSGGNSSVYRLLLTDGPFVSETIPSGVQAGTNATLELAGWNLPDRTRHIVSIPATERESLFLPAPVGGNWIELPISRFPEQIESGASSELPETLRIPGNLSGVIGKPGEKDRFQFQAAKDQRFHFELLAARRGSPLDAVLRIEDGNGKQLARNDDVDKLPDAALAWSAPAEGVYALEISDLMKRGGERFRYRLEARPEQPKFLVEAPNHSLTIEPGGTNSFKVAVERKYGFNGKIQMKVAGLPPGITAVASIPEKEKEGTVEFTAAAEVAPGYHVIQILASDPAAESPVDSPVLYDLKGKEARWDRLINVTDQLWLTILPRKDVASADPKK